MRKFMEFETPEGLSEWAFSVYKQDLLDKFDLNKVSLDSPLANYTNSFSHQINDALRRDILKGSRFKYEYLQADLLQCIVPENIVAYRYLDWKELLLWWLHTLFSSKYTNCGFVSTTLLPEDFNGQAKRNGFLIKIFVPKGTRGMYITDLNEASVVEYEFLIPHHSRFAKRSMFVFELLPN